MSTVESVEYIDDLDPKKPLPGDSIAQGDDHIRNIKKGIKQTFRNVKGEVLASHEEMNYLVGLVEPIQDSIVGGQADLAGKADKDYVDSQDALKADITYVDSQDALKADIIYVDDQDALKADKVDTYTKAEVDALLDQIADLAKSGGSMIKAIEQPRYAGDFETNGRALYSSAGYKCSVEVGSSGSKRLNVPKGMVFCLEYITGKAGYPDGTLRFDVDEIYIDGVKVYQNQQGYWDFDETNENGAWPGKQRSSVIRVEDYIELKGFAAYNKKGELFIAGMFTEA
jgi:hypothetical protein